MLLRVQADVSGTAICINAALRNLDVVSARLDQCRSLLRVGLLRCGALGLAEAQPAMRLRVHTDMSATAICVHAALCNLDDILTRLDQGRSALQVALLLRQDWSPHTQHDAMADLPEHERRKEDGAQKLHCC